jgi:hypothetical protein
MLVVRGGVLGVRHTFSNASCSWQLQPLFVDRRTQAAQVVAEALNGGLELRDAAQQHRGTEVSADTRIAHASMLRQFEKPSK